jgi:hypothetical protein
MKHDLVDNFWLMIYPITLGQESSLSRHDPGAFKGRNRRRLAGVPRGLRTRGDVRRVRSEQENEKNNRFLSARFTYRSTKKAIKYSVDGDDDLPFRESLFLAISATRPKPYRLQRSGYCFQERTVDRRQGKMAKPHQTVIIRNGGSNGG